jgi:hypothetical protein
VAGDVGDRRTFAVAGLVELDVGDRRRFAVAGLVEPDVGFSSDRRRIPAVTRARAREMVSEARAPSGAVAARRERRTRTRARGLRYMPTLPFERGGVDALIARFGSAEVTEPRLLTVSGETFMSPLLQGRAPKPSYGPVICRRALRRAFTPSALRDVRRASTRIDAHRRA